jgi:beta-mannosidase
MTSRENISKHTLENWSLTSSEAGSIADPIQLLQKSIHWVTGVPVPGTVAQALQAVGEWDIRIPCDFDARDWWYRCEFPKPVQDGTDYVLRLGGLATFAEVWLNGQPLLKSDNMFLEHVLDVGMHLKQNNELVICFRSPSSALEQRRPRPRWKTKLIRQQQMRWIRTTLLGRITSWSPPVAPVGPWRAVTLERRDDTALFDINLHPYLDGAQRVLDFKATLPAPNEFKVTATLHVGNATTKVQVSTGEGCHTLTARLICDDLALWWPHTLGEPVLHTCHIVVTLDDREIILKLGRVGFRRIEVNTQNGDYEFSVNGTAIFCRGACWTSNDIISLVGDPDKLARTMRLARDAHMNMLRIGGTMVYEQDAFYDQCNELGILVWQDFMFANMDYPIDDANFRASVETEAMQQLRRLRRHACIASYCGNSEVEQQAAMTGTARELWRSPLFSQILPELIEQWHPGTPYVASTPSGGVMPFYVGTGITHYYGVGAYLRNVGQVRRDNVKFTAECLGFSNIPEPNIIDELMNDDTPVTHHPAWKARVPRDSSAGWDFEDVRDFYIGELFKVDPVRTRSFDSARYLALGRVATGEKMSQVFAEWRSAYSQCRGGLVWFLQDLWPGAGWGVLDSHGLPKACYYYLRRAWQPVVVALTDEGLDGIHAHVVNERSKPLVGRLELRLLRCGHTVIAHGKVECRVEPLSKTTFNTDVILQGFYDAGYVYRFGPPKHDVVVATLYGLDDTVLHETCHFPQSHDLHARVSGGLSAQAYPEGDDTYRLTLSSEDFLYAVRIECKGYLPEDNYFHLIPGQTRSVLCRRISPESIIFKGYVEALNMEDAVKIHVITI